MFWYKGRPEHGRPCFCIRYPLIEASADTSRGKVSAKLRCESAKRIHETLLTGRIIGRTADGEVVELVPLLEGDSVGDNPTQQRRVAGAGGDFLDGKGWTFVIRLLFDSEAQTKAEIVGIGDGPWSYRTTSVTAGVNFRKKFLEP